MCIFCDAIEKTSKAKQLCRFRFLPSVFFRFSVSWLLLLLLLLSQLQFTQTDKAFDGQLTSALPSVSLSLSVALCRTTLPASLSMSTQRSPIQSQAQLSDSSFGKPVLVSMRFGMNVCIYVHMYVYSLQRSFNKVAIASYQNTHLPNTTYIHTYLHMKLCHQPQRSFSLFVLVLFLLI